MRQPVSHEDIADRLDRGDGKFVLIEARLSAIEQAQTLSLEEQKRTREILEAWVAAKGAGEFIIWAGKVLGGWMVIIAALLSILKFKLWTIFEG